MLLSVAQYALVAAVAFFIGRISARSKDCSRLSASARGNYAFQKGNIAYGDIVGRDLIKTGGTSSKCEYCGGSSS